MLTVEFSGQLAANESELPAVETHVVLCFHVESIREEKSFSRRGKSVLPGSMERQK